MTEMMCFYLPFDGLLQPVIKCVYYFLACKVHFRLKTYSFDIAADEAGFPIDNHIKAFQFAKNNHINCTAHAGEAKGPESVLETLENFHPSRIGHGVRSAENDKLLTFKRK